MDPREYTELIWLDRHILAYMWSRAFRVSASLFASHACIHQLYVVMDGSLMHRWALFCDSYFSYQVMPPQSFAESSRSPQALLARLDRYIINYLRWTGLLVVVDTFRAEAHVDENAVELIGTLHNRWRQFYRLFLLMYNQSFWMNNLGGSYNFLNNPERPSPMNLLFLPQNLAYYSLPAARRLYPLHNSHSGQLSVYRMNPLQFDSILVSTSPQGGHETAEQGLLLKEVVTFKKGNDRILCCDFSSDGKLLASAGESRMVSIWNTESHSHIGDTPEQPNIITGVRFMPKSTRFATACTDAVIRLWDAADVSKMPMELKGHTSSLTSVDFNKQDPNFVCSCDCMGELRLWSIIDCSCIIHKMDGYISQVLFRSMNQLAVALGNSIVVIDAASNISEYLKGHTKTIESICWDKHGTYIASVCEESARVWSKRTVWECDYELHSMGNMFRCCTFHPAHPLVLVIGCNQIIELWNFVEGRKLQIIQLPNVFISAMSYSLEARLIASASNDGRIILWR